MTPRLPTMPERPYARVTHAFEFVVEAWRKVTVARVSSVLLLCFAWSALEQAAYAGNSLPRFLTGPVFNDVLSMELNGFAVMLAVLVADHASSGADRLWLPYVTAVVAGVAIGSSLTWLVSQRILHIPTAYAMPHGTEGFDTFVFRHGVGRLVVLGLATYIHARRRSEAHSLAALRALQLRHADMERRLLESRLIAMQARIDPHFMVDTLHRVETLYATNPSRADALLKDLTAYLRAAIPSVNESGSPLVKEIALANAYLDIASPTSKDRLVVGDSITRLGDGIRIPPMILLPLIQHARGHRSKQPAEEGPFVVNVTAGDGEWVVAIHAADDGFAPRYAGDPSIVGIRERLAALYGERANLTLEETEHGSLAVLEFPREAAPASAQ